MKDKKKYIESILGTDIEQFDYEAGGQERTGWKKYLQRLDRPDDDRATKIVETAWRGCHKRDVRLLIGPIKVGQGNDVNFGDSSHPKEHPPMYEQLFALPGLPVLDLIEVFEVGSANDGQPWRGPRWSRVRASLEQVATIAPFEIQSADRAGLRATFLKPVKKPQAKIVGKIILDIESDILDVFDHEWEELGVLIPDPHTPEIPDFEASMAQYILTTGKFKLWWD